VQQCDEKKENVQRGGKKTEKEGNDEDVVTVEKNKETKDEKTLK